ncbi:glycosyltransferase family 2 protein [Nonlabens sp. Ci31]|uniref:glycosyltransferase family 2 protein n=1 Tax=Nonlabens sp. Ci31 TaxID=2608253 RepID=UPI001463FF52|nr:glycosyltransferase [Nonlabens sp. Ci31]QJP33193.1 glycosyltransferase family 2 protein [Nonlabens sp. Ci31]
MPSYKNTDLEILIATMNRNDLSFLESMFQQPLADVKANILVINQTEANTASSDLEHIKVINVNKLGLSKSRNLAIENSTKDLCWILDDDCLVMPDAIEHVVSTHNRVTNSIITFQTEVIENGRLYWDYPLKEQPHNRTSLRSVLSPEITFKKDSLGERLSFDERFGLGAQFQDSENFVFLNEGLCQDLAPYFVNKTIVKHQALNSSEEATSDRLVYSRGALAAYLKRNITFMKWKYGFFLFRKGLVTNFFELKHKMKIFQDGAEDYFKF